MWFINRKLCLKLQSSLFSPSSASCVFYPHIFPADRCAPCRTASLRQRAVFWSNTPSVPVGPRRTKDESTRPSRGRPCTLDRRPGDTDGRRRRSVPGAPLSRAAGVEGCPGGTQLWGQDDGVKGWTIYNIFTTFVCFLFCYFMNTTPEPTQQLLNVECVWTKFGTFLSSILWNYFDLNRVWSRLVI